MKAFLFNGKSMDFSIPRIMGTINLSPDSFYAGSRCIDPEKVPGIAETMIREGVYILDLGAVSTRPGAPVVIAEEEWGLLLPALGLLRDAFPETIISVDTYRSETARRAVDAGADMINDISGGTLDQEMFPFITRTGVPYVLMHIQGSPSTMQADPRYDDVVAEVREFLFSRSQELVGSGNGSIILDPGFGFGKTVEHNYALLSGLGSLQEAGLPVMAGVSRKSMINRVLGTTPTEALNGTTVLNTIALMNGADILRVHDVKPAMEAIRLVSALRGQVEK